MVLQAKPGAAIWNKGLLEMSTFVPIMFGSLLVCFSWRESEEVLMFGGKTCFFKPFLAFHFVDRVRSKVITPRTFKICLASRIPVITVMPRVITCYLSFSALFISVVKNPVCLGHDMGETVSDSHVIQDFFLHGPSAWLSLILLISEGLGTVLVLHLRMSLGGLLK